MPISLCLGIKAQLQILSSKSIHLSSHPSKSRFSIQLVAAVQFKRQFFLLIKTVYSLYSELKPINQLLICRKSLLQQITTNRKLNNHRYFLQLRRSKQVQIKILLKMKKNLIKMTFLS